MGAPTAFMPSTSSTVTGLFCAAAGSAVRSGRRAAMTSRLISPPEPAPTWPRADVVLPELAQQRSILSFCLMSDPDDHLVLPLDYAAIERILPHRYPFLLVDRVVEHEPDKRIVGVKNVSINERYLAPSTNGEPPVLPSTILTEAIAQMGAILILSTPVNRDRLIYLIGIEPLRHCGSLYPGDVVEIWALMKRLRSRMCLLTGRARVGTRVVAHGTMTFALGPKTGHESGTPQA